VSRKPARRVDLFGGKGEVLVTDLLADSEVTAPFTTVLACQLAPGGSVGTHVQQQDAEIVVVLDGEGAATVGGATRSLTPGTVVSLPHGQSLALENRSESEPLSYLIIKARPVAG
jgi:quercetin dioxygenase-like cupin family protein